MVHMCPACYICLKPFLVIRFSTAKHKLLRYSHSEELPQLLAHITTFGLLFAVYD